MFRVFRDVKARRNKNKKKKMGENRDQEFSLYYTFFFLKQLEGGKQICTKKIIALVLRSLASGSRKVPRDTAQREEGGGQEAQGLLSLCVPWHRSGHSDLALDGGAPD